MGVQTRGANQRITSPVQFPYANRSWLFSAHEPYTRCKSRMATCRASVLLAFVLRNSRKLTFCNPRSILYRILPPRSLGTHPPLSSSRETIHRQDRLATIARLCTYQLGNPSYNLLLWTTIAISSCQPQAISSSSHRSPSCSYSHSTKVPPHWASQQT